MPIDTLGGMILRGQLAPGAAQRAERPQGADPLTPGVAVPPPPGAARDEPDFGAALERALDKVAQAQGTADAKTMAFLTGQDMPIHEVMIAVTEAELAVQMTTAIATKAIQAYQEIWRLDV